MAKLLDAIVVIDVESTCWKDQPPAGQVSEIIEIGLALLDTRTLSVSERWSAFVRPEQSQVSPFCTELTTITQAQIDADALSFSDACKVLRKRFFTQDRLWASFGDYDRNQFQRQCTARKLGSPFGPSHLNVKNLFAISHALDREIGMAEALKALSLPLSGTHHRGIDDAYNIALILAKLLGKHRSSLVDTLK